MLAPHCGQVEFWAADRLNLVELPGLVFATGGLLYALLNDEPADGPLAAAVVCVLSAQGLRLLQLHPQLGPAVLMTIEMIEKDLVQWLALLLVGVLLPFAMASYLIYHRAIDEHRGRFLRGSSAGEEHSRGGESGGMFGEGGDACTEVEYILGSNPLATSWVLFKTLIGGGDAIVDCLEEARPPDLNR